MLDELTDADSGALFAWINDRELVEFHSALAPVTRYQHKTWVAPVGSGHRAATSAFRRGHT